MNDNDNNNLTRDFSIIALSIIIAIILIKTKAFNDWFVFSEWSRLVGSFITGIFFVLIFTVAPAIAAFTEIAKTGSILWMAFFGGLGALIGDLIIFRFVRNNLSQDIFYLIKKTKAERFAAIFKLKLFRLLIPFIGAVIIASPLPDEIGVAMLGLSETKMSLFIFISFFLNFLGILTIGFITK